ncbi:peptidoglycan DD-metalloendopeptidase family protein [Mucilaginibacter paludis]|uniref:Peptidase M23 n=1 Tax=Mucilaginibacter paludis DSM 18603 TaxID=714943 RepID=H1Y2Q9_9SPHI|nr:peptidoglycan DD-metalloendopeptidase family protein [Mucilaginibacter paludis]EHQ28238.1 Peptidase M23 [Mucilaginibacter paludis DSM 18603]
MDRHKQLEHFIAANPDKVGKVVYFDAARHKLLRLDFTDANHELSPEIIGHTQQFSAWVFKKLKENKCKYGVGGYFENRTIYSRSALFNTTAEPRCLHLGIDIWGDAGTMVYAPLAGKVHSFQDNDNFGDYGATIILEHHLDGLKLFSLYGHLNDESFLGLSEGMAIEKGEALGEFGSTEENGNWPPHLHFQLMFDMEGLKGDYPGACRLSEQDKYRHNIADPGLILQFPAGSII